jgi:hypothetical protein
MQRATSEKVLKPSSLHVIQSQADIGLPLLREQTRPAAANRGKNSEKSLGEDMPSLDAMQTNSAEQHNSVYATTRTKSPSSRTSQKKVVSSATQQSSMILHVQTVDPPAPSSSWLPEKAERKGQVASAQDDAGAEWSASVSSILKAYAPSPVAYGRWHDHVPSSSYLLNIWERGDKKAAKTVGTTQLQSQPQQPAPEPAARRKECVCMEAAYGSKELPGTGPNGHFFSVGSVQVRVCPPAAPYVQLPD